MVRVNGSEASARATANSAWTAGRTTGTDHMPTLPMQPSTTAAISRSHAAEDSMGDEELSGLRMSWVVNWAVKKSLMQMCQRVFRGKDLRPPHERAQAIQSAEEPP